MSTRRKLVIATLVTILSLDILLFIFFPPGLAHEQSVGEPIILYYNYENLPFAPSLFPQIVTTTLEHHFNTLMLLVYFDHEPIFNFSTIQYFLSYSDSRNLTFVPSYYIESLSDHINVSGIRWINLDMERISPNLRGFSMRELQTREWEEFQ